MYIMNSKLQEMVQKCFDEPKRKLTVNLFGVIAYLTMLYIPSINFKGQDMTGWNVISGLMKNFVPELWYLYIGFITPIVCMAIAKQANKASVNTGLSMMILPLCVMCAPYMTFTTGMFFYIICSVIMIVIATETFKNLILKYLNK